MTRGFTYYSGNVFEALSNNSKTSIAGGGRYDKVVGKFLNREIPAVGFSFSIEAIMQLCESEISQLKIKPSVKALIISLNQEEETIKLAKKLRKLNISTSTAFGQPSKALDYANALQIPYTIFIGYEEISEKKFKLKNMKTGDEKLLSEKQLINKLGK